ncbi:hypothetical protein VTK26DRAFT_1578 [Humicola hyalothermophila]
MAARNHNNAVPRIQPLDILLSLLIPGFILLHLVVAPYTKVEESFNMQAAHDILVYGTPTSDIYYRLSNTYDHFTFPGAVPRTFIGPVMLAGFAQPILAVIGFQHAQFVVRGLLGLFNAFCLLVFAQNLRRAYGPGTARWYLMLQASQFHIMFYASRTLPNMFAFGLTTLAFGFLLPQPANPKSTLRRQRRAIVMFVFAAAVFRSEVALLLGTSILHLLVLPALSLERVLFPFIVSFCTALLVSIPIDSYFWQRPFLWPELTGFYYNVVRGSASNWGVSPWHWYFLSALPRLLLNPLAYLFLIPYALYHPALRPATTRLVVPSLLFIAIYSLQPHKETRFIFYAVPPLTAAAALAANYLFSRRAKSFFSGLMAAGLALSVLAAFAVSTAMLAVSALNYPGGEALAFVRDEVLRSAGVTGGSESSTAGTTIVPVHADVLACMTGVTLFGTATGSAAALPIPRLNGLGILDSHHNPNYGNDNANTIVQQPPQTAPGTPQGSHSPIILVDKTESPSLLSHPDFYRQFTYLLTEDPSKIQQSHHQHAHDGPATAATFTEWETIAVVRSYAGIEILRPGDGHDGDNNGSAAAQPAVVGLGRKVALLQQRVRAATGGWWIGPRMAERIYILKKKEPQERAGRWGATAVEVK